MRAMTEFTLASAFPPASEADWRATAAKALKGASFDKLKTPLYEGFSTEPLYGGRATAPALHANRGWLIIQPYAGEKQAADDLANGASALSLDFGARPGIETKADVEACLRGGALFLAPGASAAEAALIVAAKGDAGALEGSAGFDPLTVFALSGELPAERSALFADYVDGAFALRERSTSVVPFLASGGVWNGAGGSAVEELAFTLAAGVSYWRALAEADMPSGEAARCVGFSLTASSDIFITIATFRAMRLLWARALAAAGESPNADLLLLAKMSRRMLTAYDPHVNLLRATAAAFGAGVGGATGVELLPYDCVSGGADDLARRIARNTSLVLKNEAWLTAVADPAAGSAYVEALTSQLASAAWALFREVEAKGGLAAALACGFVAGKLRRPAELKERAIARRREKITGVSVFPNLSETPPQVGQSDGRTESGPVAVSGLVPPPAGKGERFAALVAAAESGVSLLELRAASRTVHDLAFTPLDADGRDAEAFEALRQRADFALASIGSRPPIFLALLGKADGYRARAIWVQGFFAAGGIEVLVPDQAFPSIEALAEAFKHSPAPVACLCASNGVYAEAKGAAAALKNAGAVLVYLAGPASILKTLDEADKCAIDRLIYEGCNALAVLEEAQHVLRVEELSEAAEFEAVEEGFEVYAEVEASSY
jgi:methylmalonyl-CoA mutase